MSQTIEANGKPSQTMYESVGTVGPEAPEPPDASPSTTEYESPNGLLLSNPNPDEESSGATAGELGADTEIELGSPADSDGSAVEVLTDAIIGSYPELGEVSEVIIGTDDRIRVQNTTGYPWSAIVHLRIVADTGAVFGGTGFLVGPRTIITAGHCVFLHDHRGWARSIEVIPGRNGAQRPFGTFTAPRSSLRSVTGWTSSKQRSHDYGAIILPANVRPGVQTGTFGFASRNDSFLMGSALNLSGYPGDKPGEQWFMAQRPKSVASRVITYDIDTVGGQSGSPVWVLQDGKRYAVGVHTNGASSGNSATRIDSDVFNRMLAWKNEGS